MVVVVDRATGLRIEMIAHLARQARDYAKDHRVVLPEWGAEVLAVGSGHAVWGSERGSSPRASTTRERTAPTSRW